MTHPSFAGFLADAILLLHMAYVAFVVLGLILIVGGGILRWTWVRNPWFRLLHLAAITLVVIQAWLGVVCPLTVWEQKLRGLAGQPNYSGSFMAHWLHELLFYQAAPWVFVLGYSLFGLAVAASWICVRPRPFRPSLS